MLNGAIASPPQWGLLSRHTDVNTLARAAVAASANTHLHYEMATLYFLQCVFWHAVFSHPHQPVMIWLWLCLRQTSQRQHQKKDAAAWRTGVDAGGRGLLKADMKEKSWNPLVLVQDACRRAGESVFCLLKTQCRAVGAAYLTEKLKEFKVSQVFGAALLERIEEFSSLSTLVMPRRRRRFSDSGWIDGMPHWFKESELS